ncbi:MAG: hypothetical protein WBE27_02630 [Microgenomates group bacterium]
MSKEKTPRSLRKHLRAQKQEGEILTKKNWREELTFYLQEKDYDGLSSLGEEGLKAVTEWFGIRSEYRVGLIMLSEFEQRRSEFGRQYNDLLKNGVVREAISFITQKTEVKGLVRISLRE